MAEESKILELLGLKNDEEYTVEGYIASYRIHNGRRQYKNGGEWSWTDNEESLMKVINNPSLIQRTPRFADEEMTVLRWLHKYGRLERFWKSAASGNPYADTGGTFGLALNIADYLLKPGETVDLNELFKEEENGEAD